MITLFSNNNSPNFGYRFPKKAVDDPRFISHLSCAKCGKRMFTFPECNEIINSFRVSSSAVMKHKEFKAFKDTPEFNFLALVAKRYPRLIFPRAVAQKDVRAELLDLPEEMQNSIKNLVNKSKGICKSAPQIIKKLTALKPVLPEIYQNLIEVMDEYAKLYPKLTFKEIFTKPEIVEYFRNTATNDGFGYENIILKFSDYGYDDMKLIKNIVGSLANTFDHIIPDSQNGTRSYSNGLYMHQFCNHTRGAVAYSDIQEASPDFKNNIQKQINKISAFINAGKLTKMSDLPRKVKRRIDEYTDGKIVLNIKKHLRQHKAKLDDKKNELNARKSEHLEQFNRVKEEMDDVERQIIELRRMQAKLRDEKKYYYECMIKDNKAIDNAKREYNNFLEELERDKKKK